MAPCCGCLFGSRGSTPQSTFELGVLDQPLVTLDTGSADVKLESSATGCAVSGTGSAFASTPIEQDAVSSTVTAELDVSATQAYWEVHVEAAGIFRVGVCRAMEASALPEELGDEKQTWGLRSEDAGAVEGDVIGVAFGQAELPNLSFFLNGELLERGQVNRIRGEVYPAASVAKGAKLRCIFDEANFEHTPPRMHSALRVTQNII